jgi:hypothetical protein
MVKIDSSSALAVGISGGSGYAMYKVTSSKLIGCLTGVGIMCGFIAYNAYPTVRFRRKSIATLRELVDALMEYEFDMDLEADDQPIADDEKKQREKFIQRQRKANQVSKLAELKYGIALNLALANVEDAGAYELKYLRKVKGLLQKKEDVVDENVDYRNASRYLKYASACYGPIGFMLFVYGPFRLRFSTPKPDRRFVAEYLGIREQDILFHFSEEKKYYNEDSRQPKHIIAIDHESRAIVLAIRGTFGLNDVITSLFAMPVEFCGGIAHNGMVKAARELVKTVVTVIKRTAERHPDYTVVLCGHSLGAGTAILLTMLLHKVKLLEEVNIKCYGFAPPPVFSPLEVIPEQVTAKITNFVLEDDFICRTSLASVHRFLKRLVDFDKLNVGFLGRLNIIRTRNFAELKKIEAQAKLKNKQPAQRRRPSPPTSRDGSRSRSPSILSERSHSLQSSRRNEHGFRDLFIPGTVYLLHRLGKDSYTCINVPNGGMNEILEDILATDTCISSHYWSYYLNAFEALMKHRHADPV